MVKSRHFFHSTGSFSQIKRHLVHNARNSYFSHKALRQVPSAVARSRLLRHRISQPTPWPLLVRHYVPSRGFTAAGLWCLRASKMNSDQPSTAGDRSFNAAGLPLTDEHIATHIPASVEDYSFPTNRLRTLSDSTKTPLVLMACGSCQSHVLSYLCILWEIELTTIVSPITFLHLRFVVYQDCYTR